MERRAATRAALLSRKDTGWTSWHGQVTGLIVKHRTLFAQRVRKLRKAAKLSLENAAERGNITGNFWGDVERGNKVPSLDTIVAMAKGLALPPSTLLLLEREEDPRDIRKRVDSLLTKCDPQQLEMVHRIIKVLL